MMYRVSHVEAYRRWLLKEDTTLEDMLSYITGSEETEAMRKGTAFHEALETACTGDKWVRVRSREYTFIFSGDFEIELAPIREWRQCKTYMVDGKPIVITGKVDALFGKRIDDHKTTREFDAEGYAEGYQWRLYLDIFNADLFRWNVFECKEIAPFEYEVYSLNKLEQNRYPALSDDCQNLVSDFARFVREHVEHKQWN